MEQLPRRGFTTILSHDLMPMKFIIRRHISHLLQFSLVQISRLELASAPYKEAALTICAIPAFQKEVMAISIGYRQAKEFIGATRGIRTFDFRLIKMILYQLSYWHRKRFHDYKPFKLLRGKFSWRNFGAPTLTRTGDRRLQVYHFPTKLWVHFSTLYKYYSIIFVKSQVS